MSENKQVAKIINCPTCDLLIEKNNHWNLNLCIYALRNRVKELEQERIGLIDQFVWENTSGINHLAGCIRFQFRYLRDQFTFGSLDRVADSARILFSNAKKLLKDITYK